MVVYLPRTTKKKKEGTIVSIIERAGRESATDITMQLNPHRARNDKLGMQFLSYRIVSIVRLFHVARVLRVRDEEVKF